MTAPTVRHVHVFRVGVPADKPLETYCGERGTSVTAGASGWASCPDCLYAARRDPAFVEVLERVAARRGRT